MDGSITVKTKFLMETRLRPIDKHVYMCLALLSDFKPVVKLTDDEATSVADCDVRSWHKSIGKLFELGYVSAAKSAPHVYIYTIFEFDQRGERHGKR